MWRGLSDIEIGAIITAHPTGIGDKYADRHDLGTDIARIRAKFGPTQIVVEATAADIPLTITEWLNRDLPAPDFLMGEFLSTTCRALLVAPTGIGKTMFGLALAAHMAAGKDFLHWTAKRPARVLYVDGEMSRRLLKKRLADVVKRLGEVPEGLFALSHEDIPNFAPLNSPEGQAQIEAYITKVGGVDFIVFDNIMSLVSGDMKEELPWSQTLPWVRNLTTRSIGQLWIHHTGHNESQSYGTKTREWQMDTVMHLERIQRDDTDVSFLLTFKKARERTPDNRADFQDVKVSLANDAWEHTGQPAPKRKKGRPSPAAQKSLEALVNVLASDNTAIFQGWKAATKDAWQQECHTLGLIDLKENRKSALTLFARYRSELFAKGHIGCNEDLSWTL